MAEEKIINIKVNTANAKKSINDLDKGVKDLNNEVKETSKLTQQMGGTLDSVSGGAVSKFTAFKTAVSNVATGFKSLRVAIIASGIGALAIGILAIVQAFKSSEEGQNKFAKLMGVIGSVVGNLTDLLSDLGEYIISVFENPKKAISDFANLIKTNITNRLNGLLELIPNLGKAITLLFEGKFKEAGKVAADAVGKVTLGVESITDATQKAINKTKEFIAEMEREAKIAANIANQRATADKIERDLIVQKAEAERKRAELLEKAVQKDTYSQKERIAFLREASKLDEDITNQQIQAAKLRRDAIIEENTLSKSNKEALQAEEEAKAQVIALETERLKRQKEVTSQIQGLIEQEAATYKAKADEIKRKAAEKAKAILEEEKKLQDELKKVRDADEQERQKTLLDIENVENEYFNRKKTKEELELQAIDEKYFFLLEKAREYGIDASILEEEQELLKNEIKEKYENERLENSKKTAEEEKRIAEELAKAKEAEYRNNYDALQNILSSGGKKMQKISKALAIADVARTAFQSISQTVSGIGAANAKAVAASPLTAGMPFVAINTVKGALSIASTLASSAKSIQAINSESKNPSGSGGGLPSAGGGGAAAPSFNLVGQTGTSQLAQSLGQNEQQPVQAYVVASQVTTQQGFDNNIVETATLG